ncbi:MAG: hypothetical protein WB973_17095 [Thermoanaerobaculia bacterium]
MTRAVSLVLIALTLAGCNSPVGIMLGFGHVPTKPAATVDFLCDFDAGGTCTADNLQEALDRVLPCLTDRPGSLLRLWAMGNQLGDTTLLASATVPSLTGRKNVDRTAWARFVKTTRSLFLGAYAATTDARHRHQSPIAESLTRVAWADSASERYILVLTDAREYSDIGGDLECGALPTASAFTRQLQRNHVLAPQSLRGTTVAFCFVTIGSIDGRRCDSTLERADKVRELWITALGAAGATRVLYSTAVPHLQGLEGRHATTD